ncbi:MAG: hypothetical protein JOY95_11735, partial [Silvibacterium sp.]|nr:hypothetical protein [Silvibacterium sp.]
MNRVFARIFHGFSALVAAGLLVPIAGCGTHGAYTLATNPSGPGFILSVSPSALTMTAGGPGESVSLIATPLNGFRSIVNVTLSSLPAGMTATPFALTLTPGVAQSVTLTAAASAAAGAATVTFIGASGSTTHATTVAITLAAPRKPLDFSLTIAPTRLALTAGASGQPVSVKATALNGFTGRVSVSLSGLSSGVTASPSTLRLNPGVSQRV